MPRRSSSNAGLVVGLSSVATILLATIVVVANAASSGAFTDDSAEDVRTVGWRVPKPDGAGETAASYPSKDGKVVVRVSTSEVVGYDLGTGDEEWRVRLPTDMRTCATTNLAPDDIAAVVMGRNGECTEILAVDVEKGKQAWRHELRNDADDAPKAAAVTTAKGRIFVSTASGIARYDAKRGPEAKGDAKPGFTKAPRGCEFGGSARANTKAVLAVMQCTIPPQTPTGQAKVTGYLAGFSATSLKGFLRTELATGSGIKDRLDVVTAAPIVVRDVDSDKSGELRFFDSKGKQTATLAAKQEKKGTLELGTRPGLGVDSDANSEFVFQQVEKMMVVPVQTSDGQQAKVAGVDLERGTWVWTQTVGRGKAKSNVVLSLADDDQKRVAAVDAGDDVQPQVVTIEGKKGEVDRDDLLPKSAAPSSTDLYMSLGPAFIRLRTGETDTELYAAYAR